MTNSEGDLNQQDSAAIALEHVCMEYASHTGTVLAVSDVSFAVERGEFVALLGRSGCGKSTLLKMTAGLVRPSSGSIRVNAKPVTGPLKNCGFVFQSPVLLKWRTILKNVLFPAEAFGLGSALTDEACRLLEVVGLKGFEDRYPYELSGGMAQRVSLARALLLDPDIMLMDEPFGALDALTRQEMDAELLRIWAERHKTILFVTHDIVEAVFMADRVIVLSPRPGRIEAEFRIGLPRPRHSAILAEARFGSLVLEIQQALGLAIS